MSATPNDENESEDNVVTLSEIVEYETRNLTGCDNDDTCCTFPKGYVYRQALYLCMTCLKETGKPAAICYPCSINCHSEHKMLDLYTKRNFRCDCGNSKFPSDFKCKLWEEKDDINVNNAYNHNYNGVFCVCQSEYKESEENEDMYQCNVCEDWYHLTHLSDIVEELTLRKTDIIEGFKEFTCKNCVQKHDYLRTYNSSFVNNILIDVEHEQCKLVAIERKLSEISLPLLKQPLTCGAFWPDDWRLRLCRCAQCKVTTPQFLYESHDPMSYYYEQADNGRHIEEEDLKEVLSELPYSEAITIAEGIATLKRELSKFMSSQDPDKVVTCDDVKGFFDDLKRRRLDGQE